MSISPYSDKGFNKIYNMLFCDDMDLFSDMKDAAETSTWNTLLSSNPDAELLRKIILDENSETRACMMAYRRLQEKGYPAERRELLGVVVEVGLEDGLDVIAAYKDGTARYLNHSGKMVVWETRNRESEHIIDQLFTAGDEVVSRIGKWHNDRLPQPDVAQVRLSFLVSDGLYFGQGPFEILEKDAMGGPVIKAATQLMIFLTSHN